MSKLSDIPCIDISRLVSSNPPSDSPSVSTILQQIDVASHTFGFFNIINHGISSELTERLDRVTRDYFSIPIEERRKGGERSQANMRGFFQGEYTKNVLDWKQGFDWGVFHNDLDGSDQWPVGMEKFRETLREYWFEMSKLAMCLLKAFCLILGVDENHLSSHFIEPHPSWGRLNYYPPSDGQERLGVNPHRDACCFTILKQDDSVPGLQVYPEAGDEAQQDGMSVETLSRWVSVPAVPGGLTINIGEALQVWSNDKYFAALHRVVANNEKERFSIPYFYLPRYDTDIVPVVKEGEKPVYRTLNWGEYRRKRNKSDYEVMDFKDQGRLPNWKI